VRELGRRFRLTAPRVPPCAALRWHARYCGEGPDVGFEEADAVLACLAGLSGRRPKASAAALAELVHRRGLERASEALLRWAR
jgi:hypothetical protein